jgi:hypothetical protein
MSKRAALVIYPPVYRGTWVAFSGLTKEQATAERKKNQADIAARCFAERKWPPDRVENWIGFREPAKIEYPWRAARRFAPDELFVRDPRGQLLVALQDGTIPATIYGTLKLARYWHERGRRPWPVGMSLKRDDVLREWPQLGVVTNDASVRPRPGADAKIPDAVAQAVAKLKEDGKRPSLAAVEEMLGPQFRGKRELIRQEYRKQFPVWRGRPRKNSPS